MTEPRITLMQALDYETRASWWCGLLSWNWAQEIASWYFARKVKRKHRRYIQSKDFEYLLKK